MWLGRWARARHWLSQTPSGAGRVLDIGCAFGFGTNQVSGARGVTWTVGVEADPEYVLQATRSYKRLPFVRGSAEELPFISGSMDSVTLLDVLEHLANPERALAEARRVLQTGGRLVLSVPHQGVLARLDSLNRYQALRRRQPWLEPLDPSEASAGGEHRHFTRRELETLLGRSFVVERSAITGIGLTEVLHLVLLVLCRGLLRWERSYLALRYLYFTAYLLEDALHVPRAGYHLTMQARAVEG